MNARVTVVFSDGPLAGRSFEFVERDVFVFGRDAECHARVEDDAYLSKHHLALEISPPLVLLRDLGSRNGCTVNGRRVGGRVRKTDGPAAIEIRDGDVVRAGRSSFRVRIEDADAPRGPAAAAPGSAAPPTEPMSGSEALTVAGYRLETQIGRGASGATWLASRPGDASAVALKIVHVGQDVDAVIRKRVEREIQMLRDLSHPNIVRLLDAGLLDGAFFIALEYCADGTLSRLLAQCGRLSWDEARGIARGALRGLAFAHERGVVHRDVKPDNLLLVAAPDGWSVKVADFGLAKIHDSLGPPSGVTATGSAAGTPSYMPREQLLGFRTLRPSGDVWSAAATIYRMLTGAVPREGAPGQDVVQIVLEGRIVPIRERAPYLPKPVAAVIDRALSPYVAERPPHAGALLRDLTAADVQ